MDGKTSNINELFMFKKRLYHLYFEKNIPIVPIIICIKKIKCKLYILCLDKKIKVKIFRRINPLD